MLDLIGIFGAGALTIATPCVLPLIPIYLAALMGGMPGKVRVGAQARWQLLGRAALFATGFLMVFTALGMGASAVGAFLAENRAWLQAVGAVLIGLFGLRFLGLLRLPWLERTLRGNDRRLKTGLKGLDALVMGLVFAAGWSPCVGPVLGSVLTYTASATSDPIVGGLYLATYGLGFALPLLLLAAFAGAAQRLVAKANAHLRKVELALGVGLLAVALGLGIDAASGFAPQTPRAPTALDPTDQAEALPTMLVFTSQNCMVCKRTQPTVDALIEQCDGHGVRIQVVDLNEPDGRALANDYRLVGVPTFVLTDPQGREVERVVGEPDPDELRLAVSRLRNEPCPGLANLQPVPKPAPTTKPAACDLPFESQTTASNPGLQAQDTCGS